MLSCYNSLKNALKGGKIVSKIMDEKGFFEQFLRDISSAEQSITIISPYVSKKAVLTIIKKLKSDIKLRFITIPPGLEYLTGAVEPEAIELLSKNKFTISVFPNIHAKLYVIDENICYIGSANCTARGMNLTSNSNKEIVTKIDITDSDISFIYNEYISKSYPLLLHDGWLEDHIPNYKELKNSHQQFIQDFKRKIVLPKSDEYTPKPTNDKKVEHPTDQYERFLSTLQKTNIITSYIQQKIGYVKQTYSVNGKHIIKVFSSKGQEKTKTFEKNYRFSISKTGVEDIKSNKINSIVFILGENHLFVSIPRTFLESTFFSEKHIDRTRRAWQVQISFSNQRCFIRCVNGKRNRQYIYDITPYINNKLNYHWIETKTKRIVYKKIKHQVNKGEGR